MDPFTQRMIERTRIRREKLDQHFSKKVDLGLRQPLHEKKVCNDWNSSEQHKTEGPAALKPVAKAEQNSNWDNSENLPFRHSENRSEQVAKNENIYTNENIIKPCKFGRLAELATRIKEWEDEVDKPKQWTITKDSERVLKPSENMRKIVQPVQQEKKVEKNVIWDKSIIETLESQGYSLSQNESRLIYDFGCDEEDSKSKKSMSVKLTTLVKKAESDYLPKNDGAIKKSYGSGQKANESCSDSAVLKKAAFFESHSISSPTKAEKDPIEMTIAERKALFEKNAGEVLIPRVAFATPLPAKMMCPDKPVSGKGCVKIKMKIDEVEKQKTPVVKQIHQNFEQIELPKKGYERGLDVTESERRVKTQKEMFEKGIVQGKNVENFGKDNPDVLIREKELELLKMRWDHVKNKREKGYAIIPEPPPLPAELMVTPENSEVELKEPESKENGNLKLYPSLSEFEESDNNDLPGAESGSLNESKNSNIYLNMSFSDILEAKKNDPLSSNENSFSAELRESQVLSKMDEFLDSALNELSSTDNEEEDGDDGINPSPPKMLKSSSFIYQSNKDDTPLLHTVSFYRKQQQNSLHNQTPNSVKTIKREETVLEKEVIDENALIESKIQDLLHEINKQQTIISQASQALNLCLSTVEFSGSGEQVESERLLLLANHKRQACLNEIQRLKVENSLRPLGSNQQLTERGDLIISNITIPLKRDALRTMATVESMQYLVCLIKNDERVVATPAVSASRDNLKNMVLCFPGQYKLEKLVSDFKVTIEVYYLELSKEMLPHEVKYHIGNKKDKKLLTPIKSKKADSKLIMPHIQSPAGPNAVRSSNFHLGGYIVFSLREVTRNHWTLNKVPYTSPLQGSFSMKIESQLQLETEFKGFLTMFDDISGFGAWHRRWCLLTSHTLSYWKYPDDETRKIPIGTIDLRGVVTENVGLVSREICARLHTFLLETTRPRQEDDQESLVLNIEGNITRIRHLLSADSKEEMLAWCRKLNMTLALLRSWRCNFDA